MLKKSFYEIALNATVKTLLIGMGSISTTWAQDYIAPSMVNIPAGSFMMGNDLGKKNEKPRHSVSLTAFQMGKYPVTVIEFEKFAHDTGFRPKKNCNDTLSENWMGAAEEDITATWDNHRYTNNEYQPVTCVTWQDANDYAKWLSNKTGVQYRLPTEQEWEYSVRANTSSKFFWGDDPNNTQACSYGNFGDQSSEYFASRQYGASYVGFIGHANCDDGEPYNAIVGLYRPNPFGLYDMVGNTLQILGQCYYPGYQAHSDKEMRVDKCEDVSMRGTIWHFVPDRHTLRSAYRKTRKPSAAIGFRLASDGHKEETEKSAVTFEARLKSAQKKHLVSRTKLLPIPNVTELIKNKNAPNNHTFELNWNVSKDLRITSFDIYKSANSFGHLLGGFYQQYYDKVATVPASSTSTLVDLPESGGSFRIVAVADNLTSLPSTPAVFVKSKSLDIPGRINMFETSNLENLHLKHRKAKGDKPELYYLVKYTGAEQLVSKAEFNIDVKKSVWYNLNYRGKIGSKGEFFKLWRDNQLIGKVSYDPKIDDKISKRHKVFLEKGNYTIEMNVVRETPDRWYMDWLEFTEIKG